MLVQSAEVTATQRAQDIAATLPGEDPAGLSRSLVSGPSELSVAQVLGPSGEVLGASPGVTGEPALAPVRPAPGEIVTARRSPPVGDGEEYIVTSVGVATVAALLGVVFPILLLVVGAATYVFVGRSMRRGDYQPGPCRAGAGAAGTRRGGADWRRQ